LDEDESFLKNALIRAEDRGVNSGDVGLCGIIEIGIGVGRL
jgi:hypothetical protein